MMKIMPPRRTNNGFNMTPADMAALIAQALATYAGTHPEHQQQPNHQHADRPSTYKTFMDCKPHPFDGTTGAVGLFQWLEKVEASFARSHCRVEDKVTFATGTFEGDALTRWNMTTQAMTPETVAAMTWEDFKVLLNRKYCARPDIKRLEQEFAQLTMKGSEIEAYTGAQISWP